MSKSRGGGVLKSKAMLSPGSDSCIQFQKSDLANIDIYYHNLRSIDNLCRTAYEGTHNV